MDHEKTPVTEEPCSFPKEERRSSTMLAETSPDTEDERERDPTTASTSRTSDDSTVDSSPSRTFPSASTSSSPPRKYSIPETRRRSHQGDPMSESYHEIFDALMPPETARTSVLAVESEAEDADGKILADENTASTTRYLTSKLVEDSLRWQQSGAFSPPEPSPFSSPSKLEVSKLPSKCQLSTLSGRTSIDVLDPTCILEIERSARHLATSVDEMCENLSSVLHGISSLTLDTLETYRDGVCKTCDAVDANVKSMYQVMTKVDELNKSIGPSYRLADDVQEVKRVLDLFEAVFNGK